jgi:hydrogenase-4 component F
MFGFYLIFSFLIGIASFLNRNARIRILLIVLFLGVQTLLAFYSYFNLNEGTLGYFKTDALGVIFLFVLTLLSYTTVYHSYIYLKHRNDSSSRQSTYFAALIILIIAMTCVYLASHLVIMWVFVELTTLSVAILIYHERTSLSMEATWKYVFVCSVGITIAFIGIILLSIALEDTPAVDFSFNAMKEQLPLINVAWLKLAFLFILVGFCTKMGLFPMQSVAIDAHTVAPPPISAFISTTLMNVGFVSIFRTYTMFAHTSIHGWMNHVLLWCGLISIIVSAAYLLKVKHLKRMSAYSSIEHMGIAAIGLASGGLGYLAAIFHMILHSFLKASVFYQIDQFHRHFKTYNISDTGNYFNRYMPGGMVMLLVFIGITAFPPSGLFITEFWIFKALFTSSHYIIFVLALLFLSFAIYALAGKFMFILFDQSKELSPVTGKINTSETWSQFILLALVFYLGLNPPVFLMSLIQEAVSKLP